MLTGLIVGEPARRREPAARKGVREAVASIYGPFTEFFMRKGALLVLLFILLHKIGDTLGQLVLRLLLDDMGYSNDEIAIWDVGVGFWAYLIGIFIGGILYAQIGMKRSVLIALVLMGVSNGSFALLAMAGHTNLGLAATMTFENIASGIGGVVVVAYFSALTDLRFTASQYALISAAASIVGRLLTGTTAGAVVESVGFVNFYWLTTLAALPGIILFWWMMRAGLIDASVGTAGTVGEGDARAGEQPDPPPGGASPAVR
jgi:PAT family beta-lactamase induction signal transducer AmpG